MTQQQRTDDQRQARMLLAAAYHLLSGDVVPPARLNDAQEAAHDAASLLARLTAPQAERIAA